MSCLVEQVKDASPMGLVLGNGVMAAADRRKDGEGERCLTRRRDGFIESNLAVGVGVMKDGDRKKKLSRQSEQSWFSTGTRLVSIHACLIPALRFSPLRMLAMVYSIILY